MRQRLFLFMLLLAVITFGLPSARASAAQRCFPETNHCIDGRIREYWEQNGGLPVFGFPIGDIEEVTIEGKPIRMQRFERNRLELHPENARPYDVLLGRLGADRLTQQGRDWFTFAKNGDTGGCQMFGETGHAVCGDILKMWKSNGLVLDKQKAVSTAESLALFGLPVSDLQTETLSDGKQYQVQWFERARFELHPENVAPYNVLLGLLGNEVGEYDYSLDDKPMSDLTLKLWDFPSGMQLTGEESFTPESVAKNYANPEAALELFRTTQRLDSYVSYFWIGDLVEYSVIGSDAVTNQVTHTRTPSQARILLDGMYKDSYENNETNVSSSTILLPTKNVDEARAYVISNYTCKFSNGNNGTCTDTVVYFRNNNLVGRIAFSGNSEHINLPKITEWAQKAADRMGR
ncbi:MAG: hypothetical protein RLY87_2528 [Chloroflexota bacterium]